MLKALIVAAGIAASLGIFSNTAQANQYRCTADGRHVQPGTGTCNCPTGVPPLGQTCRPPDSTTVRAAGPAPRVAASGAFVPVGNIGQGGAAVSGGGWNGCPHDAATCAYLAGQYAKQNGGGAPAAPAPAVYRAPVAQSAAAPVHTVAYGGSCWTKVSMTKAALAELIKSENEEAWGAVMCIPRLQFVKQIARLTGVAVPATISEFSTVISTAMDTACDASTAKKLVWMSSTGHPAGAYGAKCPDNAGLWTINGVVFWDSSKSAAVVDKDRILPPLTP